MFARIKVFVVSTLDNTKLHVKWVFKNANNANFDPITAHLLVVKNPMYAKLAQTCIESFLHFHPNSKIVIHCDQSTLRSTYWQLGFLRFKRKGRIYIEKSFENPEWQKSKLDLILSLQGTKDVFFDCDLRWNGTLSSKPNQALLYFVEEKPIEAYPEIVSSLPPDFSRFPFATMKNTSVFSWSGIEISETTRKQFEDLWHKIYDYFASSSKKQNSNHSRLSEQVALSILPNLLEIPYLFLKENDSQFDGSVCESSYFGASGGRFALWGNTNRRSWFRKFKATRTSL